MELILIRHARPERVEGVENGADPGLTDIGHRQAQEMATWLASEPFDALYVSPMQRAMETCAPLSEALNLKPLIEEGLQEFDAGESQYIPAEELRADKVAWRKWLDEKRYEPGAEFRHGVCSAMERITSAHPGERVAVVCHGGVINAYAADVLDLETSMFFNADYTSINRFLVSSSGQRGVGSLNDIGHLRPYPELQLN